MKVLLKRLFAPLFAEDLDRVESLQRSYDASSDREHRAEERDFTRLSQLARQEGELEKLRQSLVEGKKVFDEVQRAHASLEISNASLQRENEFLRDLATRSIENERYALRFQANITMQSTYGVKPYADTPGLPDNISTPAQPGEQPQRVQGFEMAEIARRKFVAEIERRTKEGSITPEYSEMLTNAYSHL